MNRPLALIVDDHGDSAIIFSEAMRMAGFTVKVIYSGDQALVWLADTAPDVVILDLCLPRVAGTEILRRIRGDERLTNAYVIVISADPSLAGTTLDRADQVLVKPIGFSWLRDLAAELASKLSTRNKISDVEKNRA
ncbi:MAG: response regulator [Anaerolineae bacterium]|nr:response regulator [Anaerolineae bacterium]